MKFFFIMFFTIEFAQAQTTAIPDSMFEKNLIFLGYDTGVPDGVVFTANIDTITILDISLPFKVFDLTGIQDFTALTSLTCENDSLTNLDLSGNTNLTFLDCYNNQITNLNLTLNTALNTLFSRSAKS